MTRPVILTIAGSDPSGGAGIQGDLKVFAAQGCHGASVITALTAQDTQGVHGVLPVPAPFVESQLRLVLQDMHPVAAKIGMLAGADIVRCVAGTLRAEFRGQLVLDTIVASTSGAVLLDPEGVEAMVDLLFPLATLVTPNAVEAGWFLGRNIETLDDACTAAVELLELGASAVLLKGGHLNGPLADDILATPDNLEVLTADRIDTPHTHGTGCALSAAIACRLARGRTLHEAVLEAKAALLQGLGHGSSPGQGIGSPDHSRMQTPVH